MILISKNSLPVVVFFHTELCLVCMPDRVQRRWLLGYVMKGIFATTLISWIAFSRGNQTPFLDDTQLTFGKTIMERNWYINSHHQHTEYGGKVSWKWIFQLQSSLHINIAPLVSNSVLLRTVRGLRFYLTYNKSICHNFTDAIYMDPGWEINSFFTHIRAGSISFIGIKRKWKSLSCVRLFATPRTLVHGILQPRIWSGGDLPNPGIELRSPSLQTDSLPAEPQGKPKNTGVGSLSFLQQIFPTEELNQDLLHCRQTL